jgi:hypothetical protein
MKVTVQLGNPFDTFGADLVDGFVISEKHSELYKDNKLAMILVAGRNGDTEIALHCITKRYDFVSDYYCTSVLTLEQSLTRLSKVEQEIISKYVSNGKLVSPIELKVLDNKKE